MMQSYGKMWRDTSRAVQAAGVLRPVSQVLCLAMAAACCWNAAVATAGSAAQFELVWSGVMFVVLAVLMAYATRTLISLTFITAFSAVLSQVSLMLAVRFWRPAADAPALAMIIIGVLLGAALLTFAVILAAKRTGFDIQFVRDADSRSTRTTA
ncbi:Uncharacterized protein PBTT_08048 [Plasmodiophora brassicae]